MLLAPNELPLFEEGWSPGGTARVAEARHPLAHLALESAKRRVQGVELTGDDAEQRFALRPARAQDDFVAA